MAFVTRSTILGPLAFYGYSQYIKEVEKNKRKSYNKKVKKIESFPKYCGTKVNIII
jgi:hypothetical protein